MTGIVDKRTKKREGIRFYWSYLKTKKRKKSIAIYTIEDLSIKITRKMVGL